MVAFTLANSGSTGGFYIRSHQEVMGWHGLPHDLDSEMEDVRRKGEKVEQLSTGLNGDWFLRTDRRLECKANEQHKSSNVKLFIRLMQRAGFSPEQYTIQLFTFVPDPKGYVAVLQKADGSNSKCVWQHVSQKLDELLRREAHNGVCHVTVGKNGSHVVILKNGIMFWSGVTESLSQRLYDARREGRAVVAVSLSLISASWYSIEFADGDTKFCLPQDWHGFIHKYTTQAAGIRDREKTTSVLSSNYAPDPGKIGSSGLYPGPMPYAYSPFRPASAPTPKPPKYAAHVHNTPTPQELIHKQEPVSIQQPVSMSIQRPVSTQQPASIQPPVSIQPPISIQPPVSIQSPVSTQSPVSIQSPVSTQQPVFTQQSVLVNTTPVRRRPLPQPPRH